jgi:hypothetical protein
MNKEIFEKELYEEWKKEHLNYGLNVCEDPIFDSLCDLKSKLYEFFYPLGISSCSLHDTVYVYQQIKYAVEDDGDLSIVIAKTSLPTKALSVLDKYGITPEIYCNEIFVMYGHHKELDSNLVKEHALRHSYDRNFISFTAKRFNYKALEELHKLIPRFQEEEQLGKSCNPVAASSYFDHCRETEKLLIDRILSLP